MRRRSTWINATGKFDVIDIEGSRALHRKEDNTVSRRARAFVGTSDMANYTVEMDVRTVEKRRQQGDVGVIAQRYVLVLFGNSQKVELEAVAAGGEDDRVGAVPVEGRRLVSREARSAEPEGRHDARARQGVAARRGRARRRGWSRRSTRSATSRAARASTPTRRGAPTSTTSR